MLLSSVQPCVVVTLRVDSPMPQFSEHDDHDVVEALKHVALTVEQSIMTINFHKVSPRQGARVGPESTYHQLWAFHTAKHDNSGPAIELISALCKSPCQRVAGGFRVDTERSRRDDRSASARN